MNVVVVWVRSRSRASDGGVAPLAIMNRLPPIPDPARYAGLFVFDFGTHVSVGYTAREIRYLRESQAHRTGTAYEIYRVAENGAIELRGATDERLAARDAICFLRHSAAKARADYEAFIAAAHISAPPCTVEMRLARVYALDPANVTALLHEATAIVALSRWLSQVGVAAGDIVVAGRDAYHAVLSPGGIQIASCELSTRSDWTDRSPEEVLGLVHESLQR